MAHRYFIIYKPYNMVSQFISPDKGKVKLLGDLDFSFPEGTHAIGRLDNHSEGLLLLTTNQNVTRLLFEGARPHQRTYLVRAKGHMLPETLQRLQNGVAIRISRDMHYVAVPHRVTIVPKPEGMLARPSEPPEKAPHTWLLITLTEGKYHQVRKMVGAVKHRCQRLIRVSIEDMELGDMQPGEVRELEESVFFDRLKIVTDL
ncbi:23S rRNA pseudouridine2457 synthase [Chitinophaga eiseniae]|uniref:Pseudouridine synthase n=1 Tax=Chitinophaga eiseniae TaxID=634771 RepID=A0A1T4TVT7_9BACT|nr:pseudouridine synthase [Chitinophaga eiseniae]SKA44556.1 23S rRNA pseudouridine2457 synthase [Chitinophaga eiseniae]